MEGGREGGTERGRKSTVHKEKFISDYMVATIFLVYKLMLK